MEHDRTLDFWSPQYNFEDMAASLEGWQNDTNVTLFKNVISRLQLNNIVVQQKEWDTLLYSPINDKLVCLMRGGAVTALDLKAELIRREIKFDEVDLENFNIMQELTYEDDASLAQFWPARDLAVLDEFVADSKNMNTKKAVYYPNVKGSLLFYIDRKHHYPNNTSFDGRTIDGIITMLDDQDKCEKVVLVLDQYDKKIELRDVLDILSKYGMQYDVSLDENVPSLERTKTK